MTPLLIYMFKASLTMAALYIVYLLFLERDTLYERNRFFILLSFIASLVFPLIVIETRQPIDLQFFGKDLTGIVIAGNPEPITVSQSDLFTVDWSRVLINIYLGGLLLFGIKLMAELLSLLLLIFRRKEGEDDIIRFKNLSTSGFTAFGYIFIDSRLSDNDATEIIKHEQKHLDQLHFFDIVFIELLKIIQWFNPFIYLFDRSLREVHEFQADEDCLNSGIPIRRYQGLLLNQVFRTRVFNVSNSFSNSTIIKKRIIMMTRERSRALTNFKILVVLPVIAFLLISFSTSAVNKLSEAVAAVTDMESYSLQFLPPPPPPEPAGNTVDNRVKALNITDRNKTITNNISEPLAVADVMPEFPGGDVGLLDFINKNTVYPESAKANGTMGRVVVRFCVTQTGSIEKISVLKGVDPALDAEAARIVASLPSFKPGSHEGVAVPVWYMVPITFTLSAKNPTLYAQPAARPAESTELSARIQSYSEERNANPEPFKFVSEMPVFPGGDRALLKYINKHIHYPSEARNAGLNGRVIVKFCVTESGKVDKVTVLDGVDPSLDGEAVRVVSALPEFKPGTQGGVAVPVWYKVPVTFTFTMI